MAHVFHRFPAQADQEVEFVNMGESLNCVLDTRGVVYGKTFDTNSQKGDIELAFYAPNEHGLRYRKKYRRGDNGWWKHLYRVYNVSVNDDFNDAQKEKVHALTQDMSWVRGLLSTIWLPDDLNVPERYHLARDLRANDRVPIVECPDKIHVVDMITVPQTIEFCGCMVTVEYEPLMSKFDLGFEFRHPFQSLLERDMDVREFSDFLHFKLLNAVTMDKLTFGRPAIAAARVDSKSFTFLYHDNPHLPHAKWFRDVRVMFKGKNVFDCFSIDDALLVCGRMLLDAPLIEKRTEKIEWWLCIVKNVAVREYLRVLSNNDELAAQFAGHTKT